MTTKAKTKKSLQTELRRARAIWGLEVRELSRELDHQEREVKKLRKELQEQREQSTRALLDMVERMRSGETSEAWIGRHASDVRGVDAVWQEALDVNSRSFEYTCHDCMRLIPVFGAIPKVWLCAECKAKR